MIYLCLVTVIIAPIAFATLTALAAEIDHIADAGHRPVGARAMIGDGGEASRGRDSYRAIGRMTRHRCARTKTRFFTEFAEKQSHREPPRMRPRRFAQSAVLFLGGSRWLCFSANSVKNLAFVPANRVLGHSPYCPAGRPT